MGGWFFVFWIAACSGMDGCFFVFGMAAYWGMDGCFLFQIDYGDAGSAELYVLIAGREDVGDGVKILADELAKNAVALAMKDANASDTDEYGIVNEILNGIESLVTTHPSYVKILTELCTAVVNSVASGSRSSDRVESFVLVCR